jgi:hypothetical protein
MEAAAFKAAWEMGDDRLCRFAPEGMASAPVPDETRAFLQVAGLPAEAAPFLSFEPGDLSWLQADDLVPDLASYLAIGSDGEGSPFVVDGSGIVWLIDHEAPSRRSYVNSSVHLLAECLLAYREVVVETITIGGEDAFLDERVPEALIGSLAARIETADASALGAGTFWQGELNRLRANG